MACTSKKKYFGDVILDAIRVVSVLMFDGSHLAG